MLPGILFSLTEVRILKKRNKKIRINIIEIMCIFILIIGGLYIGYYLYSEYREEQNNIKIAKIFYDKKEKESISANIKTAKMKQLEELQKINPDIIGWISIPGTRIDYPVLQTTDNSYYLTHNYKKEYSISGSIFLDKDFNIGNSDTNYLIYGHRNKSGSMFEDLINYKDEEYYKEHPIIQFTTIKDDSEYEIIAVFLSRVYYRYETNVFRYYYFINAVNQEAFDDYVSNSKEASLYNIENTAIYGDQLLTLSTCEYSQEDGRLVVVAKKVN